MATTADLMAVDIRRSERHRTVGDMIAALLDHTWKRWALASGPVATVVQDILSVRFI